MFLQWICELDLKAMLFILTSVGHQISQMVSVIGTAGIVSNTLLFNTWDYLMLGICQEKAKKFFNALN